MSPSGTSADPPLPEAVRQRVVRLAADLLGSLGEDEVPAALHRVAHFVPTRRARAGGRALATALQGDAVFRQRVAVYARDHLPDAAAAGAADAAALAYLSRSDGWQEQLRSLDRAERAADDEQTRRRRADAADRLRAERDAARAELAAIRAAHAAELAGLAAEVDRLRKQVRRQGSEVRQAQRVSEEATAQAAQAARRAEESIASAGEQVAALRRELRDAQAAAAAARQAARDGRAVDEARLWLLVETITGAAQGLRRELALRPTDLRPADAVTSQAGAGAGPQAGGLDDPGRLEQLLALPQAHLVIDGYNVTKSGYGDLPLADQRARLVSRLAGLAAQRRVEVTVVFDGAERPPAMPVPPRGVRVLFSDPGEIADELIRRLVRQEPDGRVVVVVSTDGEVSDGVRASGAYAVPSSTLLRLLGRA